MATLSYNKQKETRMCNQNGCIAVHKFDDGVKINLYQIPHREELRSVLDETLGSMIAEGLVVLWQTIREPGVTIQIYVSYRDRRLVIKKPNKIKFVRALRR